MDNKDDEEDKYLLDTNTEYSSKISVASWVMVAWIIIFCSAISFAIWLGMK